MTSVISNSIEHKSPKIVFRDLADQVAYHFGLSRDSDEFSWIWKGFEDSQNGMRANLWVIRNQGLSLGEGFKWSTHETEKWIKKHQQMYERGYEHQMWRTGRDFLPKEYVRIARAA